MQEATTGSGKGFVPHRRHSITSRRWWCISLTHVCVPSTIVSRQRYIRLFHSVWPPLVATLNEKGVVYHYHATVSDPNVLCDSMGKVNHDIQSFATMAYKFTRVPNKIQNHCLLAKYHWSFVIKLLSNTIFAKGAALSHFPEFPHWHSHHGLDVQKLFVVQISYYVHLNLMNNNVTIKLIMKWL